MNEGGEELGRMVCITRELAVVLCMTRLAKAELTNPDTLIM